jgi:hypothetical protein
MMEKLVRVLFATTLIAVSSSAFSTPITFDGIAGIEQLEWKPLGETLGMSRTQVEAQLGSGALFEGWRFATRAETAALLGQYWPGNYSGWALEHKGAYQFIQIFGNTDAQDPGQAVQFPGLDGVINWDYREGAIFAYGANGECPGFGITCLGLVNIVFLGGVPSAGFLDAAWGLDPTVTAFGGVAGEALPTRASLLVQTTVPEPATALLLTAGLALLLARRRRRQ